MCVQNTHCSLARHVSLLNICYWGLLMLWETTGHARLPLVRGSHVREEATGVAAPMGMYPVHIYTRLGGGKLGIVARVLGSAAASHARSRALGVTPTARRTPTALLLGSRS